MSAIVVKDISKRFRIPHHKKTTLFQNLVGLVKRQMNYEEFWALKDVSFEVKHGETIGIIGRNGSGKSTLLKILARVLYPDSGSIVMNGSVASFLDLGVGFQPELTAKENVYIYSSVMGMKRKETAKIYDDIFEFAELKRFEDMKLKNFSSGMYMRLAFSIATQLDPDILLIDEVLSVGDEAFQKKCAQKIGEFREQGKTIVIVSHDQDSVKNLCSISLLLDEGRLISLGKTSDVLKDYHKVLNFHNHYSGDIPVAIDWDGDGRQELCVFRKGTWYIDINHDGIFDSSDDLKLGPFGQQNGDIPMAIDWDGDGRQELCIFRNGTWFIDTNRNGLFDPDIDLELGPFGQQPGDMPLAIDWDGNGRQELCIFRPGSGLWYIDINHNGTFDDGIDLQLGPFGRKDGDIPIAIDWNGDGKQELSIYRQNCSNNGCGAWYIDGDRNGRWDDAPLDQYLGPFGGQLHDKPLAIDWDGDGKQELCVLRQNGMWYIDKNRNGQFDAGIDAELGPFFQL